MTVQEKIANVRNLEQEYLKHKYISDKENSLESIRTFGEWHGAASVLFSECIPEADKFLLKFVETDTSGNAYVLASKYDSLHSCYEVLMSRVEKGVGPRSENDNEEEECPAVFISHCSKDKDVIKLFIDNILKKGLNLNDKDVACTSFEATGVNPGDNIPAYIKRNIKGAKICLAMISKNYKSSEVCMNEVGAVWALEKKLVQVVLPDADFKALGWLMITDKAIRIDGKDSLDSLEEILAEALHIQPPTARHWNPCTKDFLEGLDVIIQSNDKDTENPVSITTIDGHNTVECSPKFYKMSYLENRDRPMKRKETENAINGLVKGSLIPEWVGAISHITEVVAATPRLIQKSTNLSYCRIALCLHNNCGQSLANATLIIKASDDSVRFVETNVEEHSLAISFNNRIHQSIESKVVSEHFPQPINPTASEMLYDFYLTASPEVKEFDLIWKLETLSGPFQGKLSVLWNVDIESKIEEVRSEDSRIGTVEYVDFVVEE